MLKRIIALIVICFTIFTCDDGDVFTVELAFDEEFEYCEDNSGIVFFKTTSDPSESISLFVSGLEIAETRVFEDNLSDQEIDYEVPEGTVGTNVFNYRRYSDASINGNELFCEAVPPVVNITSDEEEANVGIEIITLAADDDNDGIPWEDEDENLDGDNNPATNPTDTDNDGIPNYLDQDDDGDNVYTIDEDLNDDNDDNPFTSALDSDNDGIPNYLDNDDDGDGTPTRDEESINTDNNPTNDITNNEVGVDYLNPNVSASVPATAFRTHTKTRSFSTTIMLFNITFSGAVNQSFDFGRITESTSVTLEPIFN